MLSSCLLQSQHTEVMGGQHFTYPQLLSAHQNLNFEPGGGGAHF